MKNYNYADEIIKDYDNLNLKKIEEPDILQNIFNSAKELSSINSQNKIKGFREGLKNDSDLDNV